MRGSRRRSILPLTYRTYQSYHALTDPLLQFKVSILGLGWYEAEPSHPRPPEYAIGDYNSSSEMRRTGFGEPQVCRQVKVACLRNGCPPEAPNVERGHGKTRAASREPHLDVPEEILSPISLTVPPPCSSKAATRIVYWPTSSADGENWISAVPSPWSSSL